MIQKPARWESKKWRDAARGQDCSMRIPGVCNGNNETVVLAHMNGAGMGTKADDFNSADMCSACHDVFDGRVKSHIGRGTLIELFVTARYLTIANRLRRGVLK